MIKKRNKGIFTKGIRLGTVLLLVVSILSGCISLKDVDTTPVEKTIETPVAESSKINSTEKEKTPAVTVIEDIETASASETEKQQLVTPKVTEVTDDYVWSSILALQDKVEREKIEKAEAEEAKAFLDGLFFETETETATVTELEKISDGKEEAVVVEIVDEPVEGEKSPEVYWGVLDPVEQEKVDNVTLVGDLTAVSVVGTGNASSASESGIVTRETENAVKDKIMIYRDGTEGEKTSSAPTWLYSDKEKNTEQQTTPVNVSIIQEAEKKEEKSTVTPEDILAMSQNYQAGRVSEKKVTEMNSLEIYDKAMAILQKNYQYVFLAFAVVLIALLIKAGVKHLKSEKRVHKGDIKGKTFSPEETMVRTLNPMAKKSFSEILVTESEAKTEGTEGTEKSEKDEKVEKTSVARKARSVFDLFNKYAQPMDNGDVIIDTGDDELTLSETVNLSGMLMTPAFG